MKAMGWWMVAVLVLAGRAWAGEIHGAAQSGDLDKVQKLVKADASLVNSRDAKGRTPLHWAQTDEIAEYLIDQKADVNAKDSAGLTPLATAIDADNGDVVAVLLAHGAQLDIFTASALGRKDEVAAFLAQNAALVGAHTPDGRTALHWAALAGHIEVAQLLINAKADVSARDNRGETALFAATSNGHSDVIKLLLTNNADVNAKAKNGRTALDIATMADEPEIEQLLRDHGAKNGRDVQ